MNDIKRMSADLLVAVESQISALKAQQVDDINFLSPKETIAGKIRKLEILRDNLRQEWYI